MTAPLTPADCNLQDFQFMPIDVHRLLTSETWVLGTGEEKAAAITLWLASWHQIPAGSIPNSTKMLSHLSQAGAKWSRVKEHALRGWVQASDGRLYHPVVAEKVLEAWIEKLANSLSGATGNAKRWGVVIETDVTKAKFSEAVSMLRAIAPQSKALKKKIVATIGVESPPESPPDLFSASPPESPGDRKGQGQGQGQGLLTTKPYADDDSTDSGTAEVGPPKEAPLPTQELPPLANDPAVQLTVALRRQGVNVMSSNPHLLQWLADGVTLDQLTEAVRVARETKGETVKLAPGYLVPIVEKIRNPPAATAPTAKAEPTDRWWMSKSGIERKGKELGMFARGTEDHDAFKDRIFATIRKQGGKP